MCVCIYIYILHTYIHIYIYTYIYVYAYIYIYAPVKQGKKMARQSKNSYPGENSGPQLSLQAKKKGSTNTFSLYIGSSRVMVRVHPRVPSGSFPFRGRPSPPNSARRLATRTRRAS